MTSAPCQTAASMPPRAERAASSTAVLTLAQQPAEAAKWPLTGPVQQRISYTVFPTLRPVNVIREEEEARRGSA
jgi:hypothetical protein